MPKDFPPMKLEDDHFKAFLLTNKGIYAEISVLDSTKFAQEETDIEEHIIHDEKDIFSKTYDVLFNYCPINGKIILFVSDAGKDRIQNIKLQNIITKVRRKQKLPKKDFIRSLDSYLLSNK